MSRALDFVVQKKSIYSCTYIKASPSASVITQLQIQNHFIVLQRGFIFRQGEPRCTFPFLQVVIFSFFIWSSTVTSMSHGSGIRQIRADLINTRFLDPVEDEVRSSGMATLNQHRAGSTT